LRLELARRLSNRGRWKVVESRRSDISGIECRVVPFDFLVLDTAALGELRERGRSVRSERTLLTSQEQDVLTHLALGMRTADIAEALRRSPKTIEKHRASLQRKLGLRGPAQLTAYAIHAGMISAERILRDR
jgi:DNA-binding CsgD family transcriptional regulator